MGAALLLAITGFAGTKEQDDADRHNRAKADYVYMSMLDAKINHDIINYYEMAQRARALNPADTTIGYYAGLTGYLIDQQSYSPDSEEIEASFALMKNYVYANPDDYTSARIFFNALRRSGNIDEGVKLWKMLHEYYPTRPDVTYAYAQVLTSTDDSLSLRHAMELYDSLEVINGQSIGLSSNKMQLMMMLEDTVSTLAELRRVLNAGPAVVENNVFAGDVFNALGMPDSAIVYFNRACEIDSTSGQAYYSRADFYKELGDSIEYERDVLNAIRMPSLDPDVKAGILRDYVGTYLGDSLKTEQLDAVFKDVISQHPHYAPLHYLYGSFLAIENNYEEAAIQISFGNDLEPTEDEDMWERAIRLWVAAGNREEARRVGDQALTYFPDNQSLMIATGSAIGTTDTIAALQYFNRALESLDSTNTYGQSIVYTYMGDMYSADDSISRAMPYYEKAIEVNSNNRIALNNLAYFIAITGGDLDRAEELVCKALDIEPDDTSALDTYAWVLFKKKRFKEAKEQIDKLLEMSDENAADVWDHAGDIYFMNGLHEEALEYWERAHELEPDNKLIEKKVTHRTIFFE